MKREWINSKWINATPLIIFVVFYLFFGLCQSILTNYTGDNFPLDCLSSVQTITRKYSGQFVWVFFIGINAFLGVVGLLIYFLLIYKSRNSFKYTIICLFICAFFGFLLFLANSDAPVIEPVIKSTLRKLPNDLIRYDTVMFATKVINFIADMIAVATALTIYAILSPKNDGDLPSEEDSKNKAEDSKNNLDIDLKNLLDKVEELRLVLYIATLLLVVGVLRMGAILNWSLKFLSQNPQDVSDFKEISEFFATFTLTIGSLYTILLASMYIPAYYILQKRASGFVDDSKYTKDNLAEDFKQEFFGFSIKDSLPRILAIIAPFLTGAVADQFLKILPR